MAVWIGLLRGVNVGGKKLAMDDKTVAEVSEMWSRLGLPGDGKPIWR